MSNTSPDNTAIQQQAQELEAAEAQGFGAASRPTLSIQGLVGYKAQSPLVVVPYQVRFFLVSLAGQACFGFSWWLLSWES